MSIDGALISAGVSVFVSVVTALAVLNRGLGRVEGTLKSTLGNKDGGMQCKLNEMTVAITRLEGKVEGFTSTCKLRHENVDKDLDNLGYKVRQLELHRADKRLEAD